MGCALLLLANEEGHMLGCPQISLADGVNLGLEGPGTWQMAPQMRLLSMASIASLPAGSQPLSLRMIRGTGMCDMAYPPTALQGK